jgi:hypothetical protein
LTVTPCESLAETRDDDSQDDGHHSASGLSASTRVMWVSVFENHFLHFVFTVDEIIVFTTIQCNDWVASSHPGASACDGTPCASGSYGYVGKVAVCNAAHAYTTRHTLYCIHDTEPLI